MPRYRPTDEDREISAKQMAKRKKAGVSYRTLAAEHGTSKSSAHRAVKGDTEPMRQGFNRLGSAK
jgi:hypothetical protein